MSAKHIPARHTQVLFVHIIRRIDHHPAEHHEDSAPEIIWVTEHCLDWDGDLDDSSESEEDWKADNESHIDQNNDTEDPESTQEWDVSPAPNVSRMIPLWRRSKTKADMVLMTVNTMEAKKNEGNKKQCNRICQCIFTQVFVLFDQELHFAKYYGRIASSRM